MNTTASVGTNVYAIIVLCFTIFWAKRNIIINKQKNIVYILASVITIILLSLEMISLMMEMKHSSNPELMIPNRIVHILKFSLSPLIPFILYFFNTKKERIITYILAIPFLFNALMCIISYQTGWIFFIDAQNQHIQGKLFLLPLITGMFYYLLMVMSITKSDVEYELEDKKVLIPIFSIPILAVLIQRFFESLAIIWSSISLSLLLFYIFLRELQFKYDVQTGIRNRSAFEKEMEQYLKGDKSAAIVVIDINNLKRINDECGHKEGDEMICQAAGAIRDSFRGIGKAFRIGGDEFCVICRDVSKRTVDRALNKLDNLLISIRQKSNVNIVLAYGYAFYTKDKSKDIYAIFSQADHPTQDYQGESPTSSVWQ
jgi:diguanylate cyclase (GGDEF)-like protein